MAGLAVLAPVLGGATQQWAQATVVLLVAVLILVAPPQRWPARGVVLVCGVLLLLAAVAFLPATWFPPARWRTALFPDPEFRLAPTLTPQPWRSLQASLLLLTGVVWISYLTARERTVSRRRLLTIYAGGVALLALGCILFYANKYEPPFWYSKCEFGPFPNRNQTVNVFTLGSIIQLALAFDAFNRRQLSGCLWAAAWLVTSVAIVIPGTRAGVILLFLSALAWILWVTAQTGRMKHASLTLAGLLAGLTAFMVVGSGTWERIHRAINPHIEAEGEFRVPIQRDAWLLLKDGGWHGVGPGNFAAVFAHYRVRSFSEGHAVHPESDWLWLGIELGWIAPVLVIGGGGWWLRRHWPTKKQPNFELRSAIVVAVVVFVAHGFVDVAGHRMGSVWPALFLLALLARRGGPGSLRAELNGAGQPARETPNKGRAPDKPPQPVAVRGLPPSAVFRALAVVLLGMVFWWLTAALGIDAPPTHAQLEQVKASMTRWQEEGAYRSIVLRCTQALAGAPLDAALHFYRAWARLRTQPTLEEAQLDFQRARHFQPTDAEICFIEGNAWLEHQPRLTLDAWDEALVRARKAAQHAHSRELSLYRGMLAQAQALPGLRGPLRSLAGNDRGLLLAYLESGSRDEFNRELERLLEEDASLAFLQREQKLRLFTLWARHGDLALLEEKVQANPGWIDVAWVGLAKAKAAQKDFGAACALARQYSPPPTLPSVQQRDDIQELRRRFLLLTNDFYAGYSLYRAELDAGDPDAALTTLRKLTAQKGCPAYAHYLEAQLWETRQAWREAWQAWERSL